MKTENNYRENTEFRSPIFVDYDEIKKLVEQKRMEGKKIALTNGVFDMFHTGHALYIEKARLEADFLIVGIDSDDLTKISKGKNRPIVGEKERMLLIRMFRPVDAVFLQSEKGRLIREIKPDCLIISKSTKGGADFIERMKNNYGNYCGRIVIFEPQATTSTTAKIRIFIIEGIEKMREGIMETMDQFVKNFKEGGLP